MTTYNGWTNFATWRVNLEIFDGYQGDLPRNVSDAAAIVKDIAEELICEQTPDGLARGYALAFISDVNWYEIAQHILENEEFFERGK